MSTRPEIPQVTYNGHVELGEELWQRVGRPLGMPHLNEGDVKLLDEAISILNPPQAHVRVVEVDTFMESERSIVKGDVPIGHGDYSLRQMTVIFKRGISSTPSIGGAMAGELFSTEEGHGHETEKGDGAAVSSPGHADRPPVATSVEMTDAAAAAAARVAERDAEERAGKKPPKLPEIVLFWARSMRRGGNLVVCPGQKSMNRLIRAYLVCEVVQDSKLFDKESMTSLSERVAAERKGALLGVELGEASPAEQDVLQNLISDYSFHDASIGVVSLAASIYYFGVLARNDVNVLTLLAVAVVAGLNQEATWPWVFKQILFCSRVQDPIVKVAQCRQVRHYQGQLSGQGFLAIGLAVFGVYLEVWPTEDNVDTPLFFRILLNGFQAAMLAVVVINMVQAVEPMSMSQVNPKDRLKPWARKYLDDTVFDTEWSLTLIVAILWGGIIALVVTQLSYDADDRGWSIFIICLAVLATSMASINPGVALMSIWGLVWLIPVGLAFVCRSAFDTALLLINKASLATRRTANEVVAHARTTATKKFMLGDLLVFLLRVLPLTPLFLITLPIPILYLFVWLIHLSMRALLRVSDLMIVPLSPFRLYPILCDYGSVTWKMACLSMDVENRSMRSLLKARVERLMDNSVGECFDKDALPFIPYWHLSKCSDTRLGCIAVVPVDGGDETSKALLVSPSYVSSGKESEAADVTAQV